MRIERAENDFNLTTYPPEPVSRELAEKRKAAIVKHTRDKYATPIAEVEDQFRALHAPAGPAANRHRSQRSKEEAQEVLAEYGTPRTRRSASGPRYLWPTVSRGI